MQTSLIIPTLNRKDDLTKCLISISKLSQPFDEIIIVEQGDMAKTQVVIDKFRTLNISLYFHPIKSAAQARNIGIEKAHGEFVFFIDDDTKLDKNYVRVALDYFAHHPKVVGIGGSVKIQNNFFKRLLLIIFRFTSFNNKVLRSGQNSPKLFVDKIHNSHWLGGCCCYRNKVFKQGFRFNKDFIRWSFGEDVMLSYQVYKHYGDGSLMHVPDFKLMHYESDEISINSESISRMKVIYRFIFWKKEVHQSSLFNLLCYLYGQLGFMISELVKTKTLKQKKIAFKEFVQAYKYLLKNYQAIANNKIDYNVFILGEKC